MSFVSTFLQFGNAARSLVASRLDFGINAIIVSPRIEEMRQ